MSDASVLVDLTEQVLAVDQLQPAPAEPIEGQAQPVEVFFLAVDHVADYLGFEASPVCRAPIHTRRRDHTTVRGARPDRPGQPRQGPGFVPGTWTASPRELFDKDVPTIETEETTERGETFQRVRIYDGAQPVGDPLDDNSEHDDAYRYHDVFHLAHMTVLG